jgi:hypothetical protein
MMGIIGEVKGEPAEPLEDIEVREGKVVKIGTRLNLEILEGLDTFL